MFRCTQTITVVNHTYNTRTDVIVIYPHVFTGCSLYNNHAVVKESTTAKADKPTHKARFPLAACPNFVPPEKWAKLSDTNKKLYWTLDAETVIVPGGVSDVKTWAQVQELQAKWFVTGWVDWTDTAFPHYYAEGNAK